MKVFRTRLASNVIALYVVHVANIILPMVTVPYLAHVLQPYAWGLNAIAQAVAVYLCMLIGYGFNNAGTREIARCRADRAKVGEIVAGVVGAKLTLACLAIGLSIALQKILPDFRHMPLVFYSGCAWGILQGLGSIWYFQGVEDLRVAAVVEIVFKIGSAALTFVFVRSPEDSWKVLALLAAGSLATDVVEATRMYWQVDFQWPTWRTTRAALKMSWHWFVFESALTTYSTAGTLIVGLFAGPAAVAFYSGAERIIRTIRVSCDPLLSAIFPRLSMLAKESPAAGQALIERLLPVVVALGAFSSVATYFGAEIAVRVILGRGYEGAVPILRTFCVFPLLYAGGKVIGNLWAYPLGLDRQVANTMWASLAVDLVIAFALVPWLHGLGMAIAVVASQVYLVAAYYVILRRHGHAPAMGLKRDSLAWAAALVMRNGARRATDTVA